MESKAYRTVARGGRGEIVEKRSRFIAEVREVTAQEQAVSFLEEMRKEFWGARHHCSAYIIGAQGGVMHSSDDGEPSGTAGQPMLEVLKKERLCNTAVVVARYFGGTLLGTGGLVRAYTEAVKEGLRQCSLITKEHALLAEIFIGYQEVGRIQYTLRQLGAFLIDTDYGERVGMTVAFLCEQYQKAFDEIAAVTNGQAQVVKKGMCYVAQADGKVKVFWE